MAQVFLAQFTMFLFLQWLVCGNVWYSDCLCNAGIKMYALLACCAELIISVVPRCFALFWFFYKYCCHVKVIVFVVCTYLFHIEYVFVLEIHNLDFLQKSGDISPLNDCHFNCFYIFYWYFKFVLVLYIHVLLHCYESSIFVTVFNSNSTST